MKPLKESLLGDIDAQIDDQSILIEDWLKDNYFATQDFQINDNVVNCNGSVCNLSHHHLKDSLTSELFKFGKVIGNFEVRVLNIKNLEGGPEYVGGDYEIRKCKNLESLKGMASTIKEDLVITGCPKLKSLQYMPHVNSLLLFGLDNLASLKYLDKHINELCIDRCPLLTKEVLRKELPSTIKKLSYGWCDGIGLGHHTIFKKGNEIKKWLNENT